MLAFPAVDGTVQMVRVQDGKLQAKLLFLPEQHAMVIAPEGNYRAMPSAARFLVWVVQTDTGEQLTLTLEEFSKKYGWKNDPDHVRLGAGVRPIEQQSGPRKD